MTISPLNAVQLASLAQASPQRVERAMVRVEAYTRNGRWLPRTNRYRRDTVGRLSADDTAATVRPRQLADYVAASAPVHCVDGWEYLGRALSAHLAGRPSLSRHLAYYAELRASMALLATQGVGIFNQKHFVLRANGSVTRAIKKRGTHDVAWLALESWADQPHAPDLLGRVIAPLRVEIRDWLASLPSGGSWTAQGRQWLLTWGLDLRMFEFDRNARNESSYRPTTLRPSVSMAADDAARFVEEFWLLLEPQPLSSFATLDRHLLRRVVEESFRSTTGSTPRQARRRYKTAAESMVDAHVPPGGLRDDLVGFLCREMQPTEPWPLALAESRDAPESEIHHLQVISRALLLLRTATGACRLTFEAAKLDFDDLAFWWGAIGARRGFWDSPPQAREIFDNWLDVETAIEDVQRWRASSVDPSFRDLVTTCAAFLASLGHSELVPMWSFAA
jgi:hypothetical protein